MRFPLGSDPLPQSLVFLWHDTMTILLLKLDQFLIVLAPFLVEAGNAGGNSISLSHSELNFPNEPMSLVASLGAKRPAS
jgi:hypothetical protein